MALKKCPDCGTKVSSKAAACPSCGRLRPKRTSIGGLFSALFAVATVGTCGMCISAVPDVGKQVANTPAAVPTPPATPKPAPTPAGPKPTHQYVVINDEGPSAAIRSEAGGTVEVARAPAGARLEVFDSELSEGGMYCEANPWYYRTSKGWVSQMVTTGKLHQTFANGSSRTLSLADPCGAPGAKPSAVAMVRRR